MATKLFIDTWGWLTLHDKSERYHQEATAAYQRAIAEITEILPITRYRILIRN